MAKKVMVLNGPNLNLLGSREPEVYGSTTLKDIENETRKLGGELGYEIVFMQSNHEGELVNSIQDASRTCDALILNAAAYTHTSIAIHDALKSVKIPVIEVHLSNIFAREAFRHHSYVSSLAAGVICGFGKDSYLLALRALANILK